MKGDPILHSERISRHTALLLLAAITALAFILRVYRFGDIPPGLYHDEAYNGLDALAVLKGWLPIWFPANQGREPLFIYLVAGSVALLGRSVVAIRAPALLLGLLTVPATAFLGSSLFGRRVGLLAAAVTAITLWPVHLSRVGFRAVALPLFLALALGFLWRGLQRGRPVDYTLAGLCYGITFYTYLAARFTIVPLLGLGLLSLWRAARLPKLALKGALLFLLTAAAVFAPLGVYGLRHPEVLIGRASQISIFGAGISQGDPWGTLVRHTLLALQAFFIRGDRIPRHNLPWRPIFDPALGVAFLAGLLIALKRRGAGWFAIVWVATMLLPTILAEDSPHYLRAVGLLPMLFLLPALGLASVWEWSAQKKHAVAGALLAIAVLAFATVSTVEAYFGRFAHLETVYYHFEAGSTELAERINDFLARPGPEQKVAYVSRRLWQDWPSLRFLVAEGPRLRVIDAAAPPEPSAAAAALLVTWPYETYQPSLALLPEYASLAARADLYERGDRDPEPRLLALLFSAEPYEQQPITVASLAQGIHLVEGAVRVVEPQHLQVRLLWETTARLSADYTVFVQVLRGDKIVGQDDGPPASGYLPTSLWRPGDRIVDVHEVPLKVPYDVGSDRVIVGLYDLTTMERVRVLKTQTGTSDNAIPIGLP